MREVPCYYYDSNNIDYNNNRATRTSSVDVKLDACLCTGECDSHSADALVHARVWGQACDLGVREVGVLLHAVQLFNLQVGQFHFLLPVDHLDLQLGEGLTQRSIINASY